MIPSAFIVPERDEAGLGSNIVSRTLKRKISQPHSHDHKRPRVDTTADINSLNYDEAKESPPLSSPRNPSGPVTKNGLGTTSTVNAGRASKLNSTTANEEKKRSRRLFGGLLGVVSGATPRSHQSHKKRDEIEARARERLKRENEEAEAERARLRTEIEERRQREQALWDKDGRNIRWRNMRATSGFLRTKTEPQLYWKPWEFRPEDKERVEVHKKEIEDQIQREGGPAREMDPVDAQEEDSSTGEAVAEEDIADALVHKSQPDSENTQPDEDEHPEQGAEQQCSYKDDLPNTQDANPEDGIDQPTPTNDFQENHKDEEPHDGELVEGQEDDVIY